MYDAAVVGAGAAGLMAAITAARGGARTLLLDRRPQVGAKILISGGTRCNLTNRSVAPSDYAGGSPHLIRHVLSAFNEQQAVAFFESLGIQVVLEEPRGKYFPSTHSGRTVLDALLRAVRESGVAFRPGVVIEAVERATEGGFRLIGSDAVTQEPRTFTARRVALATGGLSYPKTGSDGVGYRIARELGHTLVPTTPALTPLTTDDTNFTALAGVTVPVALTLWLGGRKALTRSGSLLFTHFGYSGPVVLDMSRHWLRASKEENPSLTASFLPEQTSEGLRALLDVTRSRKPRRTVGRWLTESLPERLAETLLRKAETPPSVVMAQVTAVQRAALARWLLEAPLAVSGTLGYAKAEVTAGGVPLTEIHVGTMESRIVPGLYLVGEMLDVDGRIGGFNFQWAWSSGAVAGRAMSM